MRRVVFFAAFAAGFARLALLADLRAAAFFVAMMFLP